MKLPTPRWWYVRGRRAPSVTRALLTPISWIWAAATARRIARTTPADAGVPVICVGNLTLGGAGKTPVTRELLRQLAASGLRAHGLSRGHGGRLKGPVQVDPVRHSAADVGDEPLMLALEPFSVGLNQSDRDKKALNQKVGALPDRQTAHTLAGSALAGPVWVARDRLAGARAAAAAGAEVVVMDDGHQNPTVKKALSLVVVDGETRDDEWPFGDGGVFPAGPMREPLAGGLARADAVILLMPADLSPPDPDLLALFVGKPVLIARLEPLGPPPPGPQMGFAGVGKPWKVERSLEAAGCELVDFAPLPDHATYDQGALKTLSERARRLGAGLVTTEKDWVRLPPQWRDRVAVWPVRARFEDEAALKRLLASVGL
jgi:tetraacyldisaccharide 4'-kinase